MTWAHLTTDNLLILIGIACLFVVAVFLIWIFLRVKRSVNYEIHLENSGNVESYYYLSIEPTTEILDYQITYNGTALPVIQKPETMVIGTEDQALDTQIEAEQKTAMLQKREVVSTKEKFESAKHTGLKVAGFSGALASFLGILGSIIPGKLGKSLKAQANQARNVQSSTRSKMNAPRMTMNKVNALKTEGNKLGVSQKSSSPAVAPATKREKPTKRKREKTVHISTTYRTQTKDLAPGEAIDLKLNIKKKKRRIPEDSFQITLKSLQKPVEHTETNLSPVIKKTTANFEPVPGWRYWVAPLLSIFLTFIFSYFIMTQFFMFQ
ncbi:hypothetical protein KQH54_02195 [bacterium]|nr:hypothetical protein [bacterium]